MNYMLRIKKRYSIELRDRSKIDQKHLDTAKKSTTDALKTNLKRAIQKTAEATGDLIGHKIVDKITIVSKKTQNNESEADSNSMKDVTKKKIYISRRKTTNY